MNQFNWSELFKTVAEWMTSTGIKVLISLVVLLIAMKLIDVFAKKLEKKLVAAKHADKTLTKSLLYIGRIGLKILVIVCLIGYLGIDTSGISALIASLGVCVGLAVNGTLSNLAGGVMLLITRPIRVDDYIEAAGFAGTVEEIHIVTTSIRTVDNKVIYIPNGTLSTSSIVNYSQKETRRVDFVFSIGYQCDFEKAKKLITDICTAHELVLDDPAPFVRVSKHGNSSIEITTRVWTKNADYWTVNFDIIEAVKKSFDENGIEIPFDQLDVHVKQ